MQTIASPVPVSARRRAFIIDSDDQSATKLSCLLQAAGLDTYTFNDGASAVAKLTTLSPDLILMALTSRAHDAKHGAKLMSQLRANDIGLPIVLMAPSGTPPDALGSMAADTFLWLEKPFQKEQVLSVLADACNQQHTPPEPRHPQTDFASSDCIEKVIVGKHPVMGALRNLILKLAPAPANVIIFGETGTGKELVARSLHDFSGRTGPFVAINCAAIPETLIESELFGHEAGAYTGAARQRIGKIEYSSGGTLFLDEIEAMPMYFQVKLLRVLQERQLERLGSNRAISLDLRVVAATKIDLKDCSTAGTFRSDLFYRLNVANAKIPSLRERREDIPLLFEHFLKDAAQRFGDRPVAVAADVQQWLLTYDWPGNVRELRNAAEQLQLGLPLSIGAGEPADAPSLEKILASVEKALINDALLRHDGAANTACTELQINYSTLYRKMKQYGMDLANYREQKAMAC